MFLFFIQAVKSLLNKIVSSLRFFKLNSPEIIQKSQKTPLSERFNFTEKSRENAPHISWFWASEPAVSWKKNFRGPNNTRKNRKTSPFYHARKGVFVSSGARKLLHFKKSIIMKNQLFTCILFFLTWIICVSSQDTKRSHEFDFFVYAQNWPISGCIEWEERSDKNICSLPSELDF